MNLSRRVPLAALFLLLAAPGCNSPPASGQVTGTVYDGEKPLQSDKHYTWTVVFVGPDGSQAGGPVGQDGSYAVENVPVGQVQIALVGSPGGGMFAPGGKPPPPDASHLDLAKRLERCKDPAKSGLTFTVASGKQQYDIRLTQ